LGAALVREDVPDGGK